MVVASAMSQVACFMYARCHSSHHACSACHVHLMHYFIGLVWLSCRYLLRPVKSRQPSARPSWSQLLEFHPGNGRRKVQRSARSQNHGSSTKSPTHTCLSCSLGKLLIRLTTSDAGLHDVAMIEVISAVVMSHSRPFRGLLIATSCKCNESTSLLHDTGWGNHRVDTNL